MSRHDGVDSGALGTVIVVDTLELPIVESPSTSAARSASARRGPGPVDRPPLALRILIGLVGAAALLSVAALLLSDRAPGALSTMFGDRARRLWERIDASGRVEIEPSELPPTDTLVHIGLWAVVVALVGLAVWSWRGLVASAVALAAVSGLLELAQGRYSTTRVVEGRDMAANLLGVGAGALVAASCYLLWSAGAAAVRALRTRMG